MHPKQENSRHKKFFRGNFPLRQQSKGKKTWWLKKRVVKFGKCKCVRSV